jgi:hypothetical protein
VVTRLGKSRSKNCGKKLKLNWVWILAH